MISNYLSSIEGVSIFPIISLIIFFSIFMTVLIWVIKKDKTYMIEMANLPLEENKVELNSENIK
ncbi:MAG: cbb3-type cytochrome c oxidase subunit 3 [Melioribacteraceae bacterium]|nr:cbb3-type cytochrome c oxidase subunit 3 [Melioribacteraceae bacterium]